MTQDIFISDSDIDLILLALNHALETLDEGVKNNHPDAIEEVEKLIVKLGEVRS